MRRFKLLMLTCFVCLFSLGFTTNAWSAAALGLQIDEYYNPVTDEGWFEVTNIGLDSVYAFAVANSKLDAESLGDGGPAGDYSAWSFEVVDQATWDNGYDFDIGGWIYATSTYYWPGGTNPYTEGYDDANGLWNDNDGDAGTNDPDTPDTTNTWDTYFGEDYEKAIIYFTSIAADGYLFNNALQAFETNSFLFSAGDVGSPFVAFGNNGDVVDSGFTNVVPIPGALVIFGSSLLGLLGFRRKIK